MLTNSEPRSNLGIPSNNIPSSPSLVMTGFSRMYSDFEDKRIKFLAIIKCIKNIQVRLKATVWNVRTDNGTEFVNQTLRECSGPRLHYMTPATSSTGLVPNPCSQGFEESPKTPTFHDDPLNESPNEDSTPQGSSSNVRQIHTLFEHLGRWTKDHPIANVVGDPSRSVSTRKQLKTDAMWCYFDAFLTSVETKNFKQAMTEPSWIDAMQEEIHKFERPRILGIGCILTAFVDTHQESSTHIENRDKLDKDLQGKAKLMLHLPWHYWILNESY
ncbi:hypothetical protein Tco_0687831 [Tanacetum coccineum]